MDTILLVNNLEDIAGTLRAIHEAYINRVFVTVKYEEGNLKRIIEKKDKPTRDLLMSKFDIKRGAAWVRLKKLVDNKFIEEDPYRTYFVYEKTKAKKTVYKLTEKGKALLKAYSGSLR